MTRMIVGLQLEISTEGASTQGDKMVSEIQRGGTDQQSMTIHVSLADQRSL